MQSAHESADRWLKLDELCDRFEAECLAGTQPRIEAFLNDLPIERRDETVRELLKVDAHYRKLSKDLPRVLEYRSRFPEIDSLWLRTLLAAPSSPVLPAASDKRSVLDRFMDDPTELPRVSGYEVLELIGRGGMGIVYKALQVNLNRLVALKMVLAGDLAGPETLSRFRAEARAVAQLQHPNLVQIYEVGEHHGRPYLAFEYVAGGGLDQRLRGEPQPPSAAARLIATLAHAIQFAHARGIIHRDLKPANVLLATLGNPPDCELSPAILMGDFAGEPQSVLTPEDRPRSSIETPTPSGVDVHRIYGIPKISDFGLAKDLENDSLHTRTGAILGTPSYMAPEQAAGWVDAIGPATDVYALGAILYEMLTGRPPFRAPTVVETLDQVRSLEPLSLRRIQPTVPRDLDTICLKCLQKDSARRYPSADALADDLDRFLRDEPVLARPVSTTERTWRWCRRHPMVATLLLLLCLVTISGVSGIAWKWREAAEQRELAVDNAARFRDERDLAQKNQRAAEVAQRRAERSSYLHRVGQARGEWLADQVGRADQLLDDCPDVMRNWEWSYLKTLCHAELQTLRGHHDRVSCLDYSPDGKTIASGSGVWGQARPGEVILWDAETGKIRARLRGHNGSVMGLKFSPDGQKIASSANSWEDGRGAFVNVWSALGEKLFTLPAPSENGFDVAFSPDGKQLAIGSADGPIRFWDAISGRRLQLTLMGHKGNVYQVQFSPDGQRLVSAGRDGSVRVWNLATGQQEFAKTGYGNVRRAAFRPDGRYVAYSTFGNELWIWDFAATDKEKEKPVKYLYDVGVIMSLAYSPEGRRLAISGASGPVLLIEPETGRVLRQFHTHNGVAPAVAFSPDGRVMVTGGVDHEVKTWDARTDWDPSVVRTATGSFQSKMGNFDRLAVTPDGSRLLLPNGYNRGTRGMGEKTLVDWDLEQASIVQTFRGHTDWLNDVSLTRDGSRYATASNDKTARIWNAATGEEEKTLTGHTAAVTSVSFHPNGESLATAAADGSIRLWDRESSTSRCELQGHDGKVTRVAFDSKGQRLASAGDDQTVRLWNGETGRELAVLRGHTGGVRSVAFSHDDRWIASASEDETVRLWDANTLQLVHVLRGHSGSVMDVAFSLDDHRVGSCGIDMTIKLWEIESGEEAISLRDATGWLMGLAFHPDGRRLFAIHDSSVRIWNSHPQTSPKTDLDFELANLKWHDREERDCLNVQNFQAALFHVKCLIKLRPDRADFHARLHNVLVELGEWERLRQSFADADQRNPDQPKNLTGILLAEFQLGNLEGYRNACDRHRALIDDKTSPLVINNAVWYSLLAPDVIPDPQVLVDLAQRAVAGAKNSERGMMIGTLGCAYFRAEQYESALRTLEESIKLNGDVGYVEDRLFLAMTESRLGHRDKAQEWLAQAEAWLTGPPKTKPDGTPIKQPWQDRLVRDILLRETHSLVNPSALVP
ncbi:MAG: protein kinase [Planctomycetota bacterium]|nr:protein kinase [Planctomycetota bacterium]